jgi:D-alanyl-D-alanine carboxypeptidase
VLPYTRLVASRRTRVGAVVAALTAGLLVVGGGVWAIAAAATRNADAVEARSTGTAHPAPVSSPSTALAATPTPVPTPSFDRGAYSIDDPASIWVVVNKSRALNPVDAVPPDLVQPPVPNINGQPVRKAVSDALAALFAAAKSEAGLDLTLQSGYRSYDTQVSVYDEDVAANGQVYADTDTARPGHSEHQTGLAVDISAASGRCSLDACFGQTDEGRWLAANAWRFGFLLRYPQDKVAVTGFTYEPWHFRYVGVPLATELHETGVTTLEEYFGVPGGESYPG